ncbi:MAG: hypothetical protein JJU05_18855 [Verrucomicrobia bacterium]|nr:hypothetical protein [Verrucomicrobiota bacterium]MCH8525976.1 hypothetical protein [Kiritimatiellia bacterium]
MPNKTLDVGERRAAANAGVSFRAALMAVAVFYVVAGLLNGHHLHEGASRREYGGERTFWMTLTLPLDRLSRSAGLERFRRLFEPILEDSP